MAETDVDQGAGSVFVDRKLQNRDLWYQPKKLG
jgi:hypothetical protein